MLHQKRGRKQPEVYRTRVEPLEDGGYNIVAGKPIVATAKGKLASKDQRNGESRRMAGEALLSFNPAYDENKAATKYSRINDYLGKEVHHLLEVDTTYQYMSAMQPQQQRKAAANALADGFRFSDHKNNQTALYGDLANVPGPRTRAGEVVPPKGHPGKGEHQTTDGVHQKYDQIAKYAGLPNSNEPGKVANFMNKLGPDQKVSAFAAHTQASRLAVQRQKNVNEKAQDKTLVKLEAAMAQTFLPLPAEQQAKMDTYVQQRLRKK